MRGSNKVLIACQVTTLLISLFCISCKEEKDDESPVIQVETPYAGSVYEVGDSIYLKAVMHDNEQLESVKITLMDSENRPALPSIIIESPNNPYLLNAVLPISDSLLESGVYELNFQAFDGFNTTNAFVKIQLNALPVKFLYPVVITKPATNQVEASLLDSNSQQEILYTRQGDYAGSAIDPRANLLYLCGAYTSSLVAFNLREKRIEWELPGQQIPEQHWFEGISFQKPYLFVSYYQGYIKALDNQGVTSFTTENTGLFQPYTSCMFGDWLAAALREKETDQYAMAMYYVPGGTLHQLFSPTPAIVGLYQADVSHLLAFGNTSGNSSINVFDKNTGTFSQIKVNTGDSIYCVSAMDPNNYILAGKDKLYWYSYTQNSLVVFALGNRTSRLACEKINRQVYVASGDSIRIYTFPEGILSRTFTLSNPVLDIQLLYNK